MKTYIIFFASFLLISCSSSSQIKTKVGSEFITADGKLKEYSINSCLIDMLNEVVNLDTAVRFPPRLFYYDLSYENRGSYKKLTILPARWEKSMTLDFKGIIRVGEMFFLCRGDIENDSLFRATEESFRVLLKKPIAYQYDSVDVVIESYSWKPTLVGKFTFCKGITIDLYILVGNKMEKYKVKRDK
jgi:uncharacterized protein YcfL